MTILTSTKDDLFNLGLISSYVDKALNPRFVERHWLKQQVEAKLVEPDCRFLLLTAEPGAGKSALMAWLADQHPDWCRYFIRRDQRTPLGDPGTHSFLLQIGFQLAATYPDAFNQEQLRISVAQRFSQTEDSEIVGAEIKKLIVSPFYETVVQIQQEVSRSKNSKVVGIRIDELYSNSRLIDPRDFQFMALFDPASTLLRQNSKQRIVVLVDALDELRYQKSELSLLEWLTHCPELPANLRFVLTCRPDEDLLREFRGSQQGRMQEISIAEEHPEVEKDLTLYTHFLIQTPEVNQTLLEMHQDSDEFIHQATTKANGNFGYLGAIGRAVDEAIRQEQPDLLKSALDLAQLPNDLQDLYAYFLAKIKRTVDEQAIRVTDPQTGRKYSLEVWPEIYQPILGILSVAREPLTIEQIQKFGDIPGDWQHLIGAIDRLRQFLDKIENCYSLYHSTLPEFFTSPKTQTNYDYCYVDSVVQNRYILSHYQAGAKSWAEVDLKEIAEDDYGLSHLAQHLVKGDQVEELHSLLRLEKDGKNAWFKVKDDEGETAGFLADVDLAWAQADAVYNHEPGRSIGLQCRYALMKASINSLALIPTRLFTALAKHPNPYWKIPKTFAYARQIPDSHNRFESLAALANELPDSESLKHQVLQSALEAALSIQNGSYRVDALVELSDQLPEVLSQTMETALSIEDVVPRVIALAKLSNKLPDALFQGIEAALSIQNIPECTEVLKVLINSLPIALLPKTIEATRYIKDEECRFSALITLVKRLPLELLLQAQEAALSIEDEKYRTDVLKILAEKFDLELLPGSPEVAQRIQNDNDYSMKILEEVKLPKLFIDIQKEPVKLRQATALVYLANKHPSELCPEHLLEAARSIQEPYWFNDTMKDIVNKLPLSLLIETLLTSQEIQDESFRTKTMTALINRIHELPEELLPNALENAQLIENEIYRAKLLRELVDKLPDTLLPRALAISQSIHQKWDYSNLLAHLANRLPEVIPKALESAQAIEDKLNCAKALISLADKLPSEFLLKILEIVQVTQNESESDRIKLLKSLVDKLPRDLYPMALKAVRTIQDQVKFSKDQITLEEDALLDKMALSLEHSPFRFQYVRYWAGKHFTLPKIIFEALEAIQAFQKDYSRTDLLIELVKKLPSKFLLKVLEAGQVFEDTSIKAKLLIALADKLTPTQLPQTLKVAQSIQNEFNRAQVLTAIANKFPEILPKALELAQLIEEDYVQALTLTALANKRPDILLKALDVALAIRDQYFRADALRVLADKLTPELELLPQMIKAVKSIQNASHRAQILIAIAVRFPEALPTALESAQSIQNSNDRAHQLVAITQKFPEYFPMALEAVQSIQNEHDRHEELIELSKYLVNDSDRFKRWTSLLHLLAYRRRSSLLNDIAALAPVLVALGDETAVLEVSTAIEDVSRWWS
jgi:hypothetical protein